VIELVAGPASARVDPSCGARIADLTVDAIPILVTGDSRRDDPLDWGLYPMVPFAGRLRHGELPWRGETYHLPLRRPPHAIHGTVLDVEWQVIEHSRSSCTLSTPLVSPWPFAGRVDHEIVLTENCLDLRLTVRADVDMPVQIGWHPWFRKPSRHSLPFRSVHRRDDSGIAEPVATPVDRIPVDRNPVDAMSWGDVDDCFTDASDGLDDLLMLEIDGLVVELRSTCEHWVVFDRPTHATCVEPQSGPPNVLAVDPRVVSAGTSHHETFSIAWRSAEPRTESERLSARSTRVGSLDHREGRRP
jgi:aldose 1-epimerase